MGKVSDALNYAVDAAGNPVQLQEHQVQGAHEAGFTPIGAQYAGELQGAQENKDYVDEHYGTAGKAALGALNGVSLGLAPMALNKLGLLDKGHLEAAGESGAFQAGDIAGMLLPAFLSGGATAAEEGAGSVIGRALARTPAGLLGEAGGAAERLAARFLPEAGIMGKLASPTLKMAARGATEGAIVNLSHTVSDNVIQNKPLAAQSLMASGLNGALFGGLTGGILGGASAALGAGIDVAGGRVAQGLGGAAEGKAGTALKRLGASEGKLAELAARDGDLVTPLKGYYKVLQDGGENLASETGAINKAVKNAETKYGKIAEDAVQTLQKEHPSALDGRLGQMTERIKTDLVTAYQGTLEQGQVSSIYSSLRKDLSGMKTWEHWAKTREQLADRVAKSSGIQGDIYKTALNAFDDELAGAMQRANPQLADQYAAAVTGQRQARELSEMTGKRAASEASRGSSLHMNGADAATFGYSVLAGANPLVGAGIIAGKKLVAHAQQALQPAMAEAAYRSAIGANAAHAQVAIGQRVSAGLKSFLTGARLTAEHQNAKSSKPSYTMDSYQKTMDMADELTSATHMAKVREMTAALSQAGHPELAQEMGMTYGRAVAYVNQNKPKGSSKEHAAGRLGKTPKSVGISTEGMKFIRQLHSMTAPVDAIIGGLERGDVSSDAVQAIKYVFPDLHQDLVFRASQEIMDMKAEGKFVPADKIVMLGVALDATVDSTLEKGFIDEVQQGLAANKAPQKPAGGNGPPPVTDISQYQTPIQSSV